MRSLVRSSRCIITGVAWPAVFLTSGCQGDTTHTEALILARPREAAHYRSPAQPTDRAARPVIEPDSKCRPTAAQPDLAEVRPHTLGRGGLDFDPDARPSDGRLVYASARDGRRADIFLIGADESSPTQLTFDPADDIQPRFSPDGKQIAFASNRSGSWDIWMMNCDGTGLTRITSDHADELAPCWSPDGARIAYSLWNPRSHQWEIWSLALEQPAAPQFLTQGMFPAWSPDGQRIAFQRARARGSQLFSIWTIDLQGGQTGQATEIAHRDAAACIAPSWSPDGTRLVFCTVPHSRDAGNSKNGSPSAAELWVKDLGSGRQARLTNGPGSCFNPAWTDDGRIFFVWAGCGTESIWSISLPNGDRRTRLGAQEPTERGTINASFELTED